MKTVICKCFRYDMARPDSRCILKAVTIQSGAIATIFYVIGLIFSLSIAYLDDKIGLYDKNPELWDIEGHETVSYVHFIKSCLIVLIDVNEDCI